MPRNASTGFYSSPAAHVRMVHQVQQIHVGAGEFAGYPTQPGLAPSADFAEMPMPAQSVIPSMV